MIKIQILHCKCIHNCILYGIISLTCFYRLKNLLRVKRKVVVYVSTAKNPINQFNYTFKRIELIPAARNNEKTSNLLKAYCEK